MAVSPSMAIVDGNPAIAYWEVDTNDFISSGRVMFIRATDAQGSAWGSPVEVSDNVDGSQDGQGKIFVSLAVASNGYPYICYNKYSGENVSFYFRMASNTTGGAWGTERIIDGGARAGQYSTLVTVDGRPAVLYHQNDLNYIRYCRASAYDGSTWQSSVLLDNGGYSSMAIVNGNPACAYRQSPVPYLGFVRATNSTGDELADWNTPATIYTNHCNDPALAVVNGKPAIAFKAEEELCYIQSDDANGNTWSNVCSLATNMDTVNIRCHCELQVIDGNPAIAYYDPVTYELKFIKSSDQDGAVWTEPQVFDSMGAQYAYEFPVVSLLEVDGLPAIAYYSYVDQELCYVRQSFPDDDDETPPYFGGVNIDGKTYTAGSYSSGLLVTGLVCDVDSGIYGTNGVMPSKSTLLSLYGPRGDTLLDPVLFSDAPASDGAATTPEPVSYQISPSMLLDFGSYTTRMSVWDYDVDRTNDSLQTVVDYNFELEPHPSSGSDLVFINFGSGPWTVASNWLGNIVPRSMDTALINSNSEAISYTAYLTEATTQVANVSIWNEGTGIASLGLTNAELAISGNLQVHENGRLSMDQSSVTSDYCRIGQVMGDVGIINVNDSVFRVLNGLDIGRVGNGALYSTNSHISCSSGKLGYQGGRGILSLDHSTNTFSGEFDFAYSPSSTGILMMVNQSYLKTEEYWQGIAATNGYALLITV